MTAAAYFSAWLAERVKDGALIVSQGEDWAVVEYRGVKTNSRALVYKESPASVRVERLGLLGQLRFALGRR